MDIRIPSLLRIKPDALFKLGKYLRKNGFDRIVLFYGDGIEELVGQSVRISLASSEIAVLTQQTVHSNDVLDIVSTAFHLPRGSQAIVAVGGGVAVDVGKYVAFLNRVPVIAVPTAISNDGFASPGASLRSDGNRVSAPATIPFGVVIDTTVIRNSPPRFIYSGIGDLISKYSAIADWKRSYHATGEPLLGDDRHAERRQSGQPSGQGDRRPRLPAIGLRRPGDERSGDGGRRVVPARLR